jgi:hypothetical protein
MAEGDTSHIFCFFGRITRTANYSHIYLTTVELLGYFTNNEVPRYKEIFIWNNITTYTHIYRP